MTKSEDAERFVDVCVSELGGVDVLVNNVGGSSGGPTIFDTSDEDWHRTFDISFLHGVRMTQLVAPHMKNRGGGAIVNVSSISGWSEQLMGTAQYGAAKSALIFVTERLALEMVKFNVRVNTVSPGSIQHTRGWESYRAANPAGYDLYVQDGFPMGRWGTRRRWRTSSCSCRRPGRTGSTAGTFRWTGWSSRREWRSVVPGSFARVSVAKKAGADVELISISG